MIKMRNIFRINIKIILLNTYILITLYLGHDVSLITLM